MFDEILTYGRGIGASDIHILENEKIYFRVKGELISSDKFKNDILKDIDIWSIFHNEILYNIGVNKNNHLSTDKKEYVDKDFAYTDKNNNRYRVSIFESMRKIGLVIRIINNKPVNLEENFINKVLDEEILNLKDGLVLVTGITGSGKSTTLANIIEKFNEKYSYKILTIEDPIEYVYKNKKSIIIQREIGEDTESFRKALKSSLRQDPDIVMVGEIRDEESLSAVLTLAETGHLVFSTLHTMNTVESINRMLSMVAEDKRTYVKEQLSSVLRFIFSQELINKNNKVVLIFEILNNTKAISNLILTNKFNQIPVLIESGIENNMITKEKYKKLLE